MFYGKITKADFKVKICRYFMNYCNNHHISSTNDGLSAMVNIKKCQLIFTISETNEGCNRKHI